MTILYSILELTFVVALCASIAGLAVSLGKWKMRMGLVPSSVDQRSKKHIS
jgi:hypothetical protein